MHCSMKAVNSKQQTKKNHPNITCFIKDLLSVIKKMTTGLCGVFLLYSHTELQLLIHKMLKHFDKRSELILAYNFQHLICCVSTPALLMWLGQMNELNDMSKCAGCNTASPGASTGLFSSSSERKALNIFITNPLFLLVELFHHLCSSCWQKAPDCSLPAPTAAVS